jgi:flagellar M-ring protein FliF
MDSMMQGVSRRTLWLVAGGVAFVLGLATALFFAFSPHQAVLFADLRERDLASMSEELRKKKIAFEVGADGRSLLVPEADVHKVRMQLMAQDITPALSPGSDDRVFAQYATDFASALDKVAAAADCTQAAAAVVEIGNACQACHRDYR